MDCKELWNRCLDVIKDNVNEAAFNTWFLPIVPLSYEHKEFILQVPSQFFYEYIEEKYIDLLSKTLYREVGDGTRLRYRILMDKSAAVTTDMSSRSIDSHRPAANKGVQNPFKKIVLEDIDPQLNWNYNFDSFIEGKSNKLARSAGLTIANNPGNTAFNPLFLYGPSGVGKTHLVHAIGVAAKAQNPKLRVLYVTANLFQFQYTNAVRQETVNDFINFYQTIDLLIMDDIHEIIGKKGTQNTFFNIFNHLHQMRKQIILTCDRMPAQMKDVEERLLTRFKWGLVAEIERPDFELRKAILNNKIYVDGLKIDSDVIDYIAENITENIRDLEGVLVSLLAQSTFKNLPIDLKLAEKVVGNLVSITPISISLEQIKNVVCSYFNLDIASILTKSRKREVVQARQIAMYLSKQYTKQSLSSIGQAIGNRDHATVLHACKTVNDLMSTDKNYKSNIQEIEARLRKS